jgi:hypothetical protein
MSQVLLIFVGGRRTLCRSHWRPIRSRWLTCCKRFSMGVG